MLDNFPPAHREDLRPGDLLIREDADLDCHHLNENAPVERVCVVLDNQRNIYGQWFTEVLFLQTNRVERVVSFYSLLWMWYRVVV